MSKSKHPPPRKTVKAKGALPAPIIAPVREHVPWYKRPKSLAIVAALLVFLIGFGIKTGMDLAESADERERRTRTLGQFERRIQLLNAELPQVFEQISDSPGAYLAGALAEDEFQQQADAWVESFRELHQGIRNTEVPEDMERLIEAKGLFLYSALIYTDAAKTFALAPSIQQEGAREEALVLARNELIHGSAILSMAERRFVDAKNELGVDERQDLPGVHLPDEEAPPPPPIPDSPEIQPPPTEAPAEPDAEGEEPAEPQPTD